MSETKITKRERNEKLTNRYMVQLTWGIVGILIFILVYRACLKPSTLVMVQPFAWVMTAVFPISAIVLTFLGKSGVIKNKSRAYNYAIFTGVCTFFALWLAYTVFLFRRRIFKKRYAHTPVTVWKDHI